MGKPQEEEKDLVRHAVIAKYRLQPPVTLISTFLRVGMLQL
jgi:hypothetical protein